MIAQGFIAPKPVAPGVTSIGPDPTAERVIFWTVALVPLWWILGLQVAVYPLVGWYLFWHSMRRPTAVSFPLGWNLWWVYIGLWLLSLMGNLAVGTAEVGRGITALGSIFGVWMLFPVVWYAMRRCEVRCEVIVRAICVLGLCQLAAVMLGEFYLRATGSTLQTQSLLVSVLPSIPARVFFEARLYGFDELVWDEDPIPRLKSFYYWSPLAGTMSLFICTAALGERQRFWKGVAIVGALATIWFSAARAAQVGVVLALLIALWFGGGPGRRLLNWLMLPLFLVSPVIVGELYKYFFEYRSGSGVARLMLYNETFNAFLQQPVLGYGAHGRSDFLPVPLGSHSQIFSTLYHTGVLGTAVLAVAWVAIAVALVRLAWRYPDQAGIVGAWAGLTLAMSSGELEAASVTVFVLAAWLGCVWNASTPTLPTPWTPTWTVLPTPWQSLTQWWRGSNRRSIRR